MSAVTLESLDAQITWRLANRLAGHAQDTNRPWTSQVVSWMDLVDLCREVEDRFTAMDGHLSSASEMHKEIFITTIRSGERLIERIRTQSVDISLSGHRLDILEASLELIRILYRGRHPDLSPDDVETTRRRIFNATA